MIINPSPMFINIKDDVPSKNHSVFSYLDIIASPKIQSPELNKTRPKKA